MSEQIEEAGVPTNNEMPNKPTRDVDNTVTPTQGRQSLIAARLVWFLAGVLLVLLAFRFVLLLMGANPANGFANFIYTTSYPFAAPFFGLFGYSIKYGVSRVEVSTLIAMAVYGLVAFGIYNLLNIGRASNT